MKDKAIVVTTFLILLIMLSTLVIPSFAFVYPDGSQDTLYERSGPRVDRILIKMYDSLDAEIAALQNGEIDITDFALTKPQIDVLSADPNVRVLGFGGETSLYTLNFNNNPNQYLGNPQDPFYPNPVYATNPCVVKEFRQACSYLLDRVALCAGPGQGMYEPVFTPIPAYMQYWIHPDISYTGSRSDLAYPPSIADAAATLENGGFPKGTDGYRYWDKNHNGIKDAGEELNVIIYARTEAFRQGAADMLCAGLDDPTIQVAYTRFQVAAGVAWQKVMVEKDYHMYTAGWIFIGPDPDALYYLYHWDNYYHPEDPPNYGAISQYDTVMQDALEGIKYAPNALSARSAAYAFQERFAEVAAECPLGSTSAPKAYNKWYTGGNDGIATSPDDGENAYRNAMWTHLVNENGKGENSWWSTLNMYPEGHPYGDGSHVTVRYGWKDASMPWWAVNPFYSSWYWEYEITNRVYDTLGGRNPYTQGSVDSPQLAESWTQGTWVDPRDGITKGGVTVTLRPDVLWSDGQPLTIDDVIYTLVQCPAELQAKGCYDPWWQPTADLISGFYKLDKYTARILCKDNTYLTLNCILGNIVIPKHIWQPFIATHTKAEIQGDIPPSGHIGTGPFIYQSIVPGSTVTMVRNPLHYARTPVVLEPSPVYGKGIWIYTIWLYGNPDTIIARLESAKVKWVAIKCGDSNSYYLRSGGQLAIWADSYGGFPQIISKFHQKGIKVLGTHFARSYNHFTDLPGVTELDVAKNILSISGIDGLLINAENDTMQAAIDNYRTYLTGLRSTHPNDFIAYNSYDSAPPAWTLRVALHSTFTTYCDASMPEVYWTVSGRTPAQALSYMESSNGIGKLVQGKFVDRWHGKPILPMGISGPAFDLGSREILAGEIKQFCDTSFAHGYSAVSLYAYHIMHSDPNECIVPQVWKWTEYSGCFNPDTTFAVSCPVDLLITDPAGLAVTKGMNQIESATYTEFDVDGIVSDEVSIIHRKMGDYFVAVMPELGADPNDTYTLEVTTGNITIVLAENVSISDIPSQPYIVTCNETSILPRFDPHDLGLTRFPIWKTLVRQRFSSLHSSVGIFNYGSFAEVFNVTVYANTTIIATFANLSLASRESMTVNFTWGTTGFATGNYSIYAQASSVPDETYTADNAIDGGWVFVTWQGDVNEDRIVDIFDIVVVAIAFNSQLGDSNWNYLPDINSDTRVDIFDIVYVAIDFGKSG